MDTTYNRLIAGLEGDEDGYGALTVLISRRVDCVAPGAAERMSRLIVLDRTALFMVTASAAVLDKCSEHLEPGKCARLSVCANDQCEIAVLDANPVPLGQVELSAHAVAVADRERHQHSALMKARAGLMRLPRAVA